MLTSTIITSSPRIPDSTRTPESRIWFLQLLRAVAILIVVFSHSIIGFCSLDKDLPRAETAFGIANLKQLLVPVSALHIDLGVVGVSIFFLISGFLIPLSIKKYGPFPFLVARVFRIFPTYAFALGLIALISAIYFSNFHASLLSAIYYPEFRPPSLNNQSWSDYLWSFLLLDEPLQNGFIDPVVWTLRIEVLFYLLSAFLNFVSSTRHSSVLLLTGTVLCFLSTIAGSINPGTNLFLIFLVRVMTGSSSSLIFMFIGTVFYNYCAQKESPQSTLDSKLQIISLFLLFLIATNCLGTKLLACSYSLGFVLFCTTFIRRRALRKNLFINWIADISYPIYLTHNIVGGMLTVLIFGLVSNVYLAISLSLISVLCISHLLHIFVERPFNNFGKSLSWNLKEKRHRLEVGSEEHFESNQATSSAGKLKDARPSFAHIALISSILPLCIALGYYIFAVRRPNFEHRPTALAGVVETAEPLGSSNSQHHSLDSINQHLLSGNSNLFINSTKEPEFLFAGWAVKPETNSVEGAVFGIIDNRYVIPTTYGSSREDVAGYLHSPTSSHCGFIGGCHLNKLNKGQHNISLAILDPGKESFYVLNDVARFKVQ